MALITVFRSCNVERDLVKVDRFQYRYYLEIIDGLISHTPAIPSLPEAFVILIRHFPVNEAIVGDHELILVIILDYRGWYPIAIRITSES